jgi:hypothetical protein
MKTPFNTTVLEMLKDWGTEITMFLVGVALLVFLTASFNRAIEGFSSTASNGATIESRTPATH